MFGVTPVGIAAVGPDAVIAIRIEGTLAKRAAILDALADGASTDCLVGIARATFAEAQELIDLLRHAGALSKPRTAELPDGCSLADALTELGSTATTRL